MAKPIVTRWNNLVLSWHPIIGGHTRNIGRGAHDHGGPVRAADRGNYGATVECPHTMRHQAVDHRCRRCFDAPGAEAIYTEHDNITCLLGSCWRRARQYNWKTEQYWAFGRQMWH